MIYPSRLIKCGKCGHTCIAHSGSPNHSKTNSWGVRCDTFRQGSQVLPGFGPVREEVVFELLNNWAVLWRGSLIAVVAVKQAEGQG